MNFREYTVENIERVAVIREELKKRFNAVDRDLELIMVKAAIEPWGLVKPADQNKAAGDQGKVDATKREALADIIAKYDLIEDNGLLKPRKFLDHGFKDLAQELEAHGYRYNKEKRVFMPPWNGVKK